METSKGEIVLYNPNETIRIEVRFDTETVWLTVSQIADLFGCSTDNVGLHIRNIYKEQELEQVSTTEIISVVRKEGTRMVARSIVHYNLDVILSVGYRVNSRNATLFRQWANKILKDYLLHGYVTNKRLEVLEKTVSKHSEQIEMFIKQSLPPQEGIFFNGQIFDAYVFACNLIKRAKRRIILIDNYVDESVLLLFSKRAENVSATIYTQKISEQFRLDVQKHNNQYPQIDVKICNQSHDRFLIIDDELYLVGASLKDLGKKWFGFSKMESFSADAIIARLDP